MQRQHAPLTHRNNRSRFAAVALRWTVAAGPILAAVPAFAQSVYRATPGVRIRPLAVSAAAGVGNIAAVAQLTNGVIAVGDNVNAQVHLYSAGGRYLKSVGRKGVAPGEFNTVRWIGECAPNQIFVYDNTQNRISVFSENGDFVRSVVPAVPRPALIRCNTDGTILLASSTSVLPDFSQRGSLQLNDSAGRLLYRSPELLMSDGRPLGKQLSVSMSPDGVAYGNGERDTFTMMSVRGEGVRQVQAGIAGRVPTEVNQAATIESWASLAPNAQEGDRMRLFLKRMKPVAAMAAYNDLTLDPNTRVLWARTSNPGDPETILERRGLDGALQGRVALPAGVEIFQIRSDVLIGRVKDPATGEEQAIRFRISR